MCSDFFVWRASRCRLVKKRPPQNMRQPLFYSFTWWQVGQVFPPGGSCVPHLTQSFGSVEGSSAGTSFFRFSAIRREASVCSANSLIISEIPRSTPKQNPAPAKISSGVIGSCVMTIQVKIAQITPITKRTQAKTRRPKAVSLFIETSPSLPSL